VLKRAYIIISTVCSACDVRVINRRVFQSSRLTAVRLYFWAVVTLQEDNVCHEITRQIVALRRTSSSLCMRCLSMYCVRRLTAAVLAVTCAAELAAQQQQRQVSVDLSRSHNAKHRHRRLRDLVLAGVNTNSLPSHLQYTEGWPG